MKNPIEVLRAKEQELLKVKREIEALRLALPLLGDDEDTATPGRSIFGVPNASKVVSLP
jgi:hypothetical protein